MTRTSQGKSTMLPALRNRSIKVKLVCLAAISGCVSLFLASAGFVVNDLRMLTQSQLRQWRTQADLVAYNGSAALLLKDKNAGEQLLASLKSQPTVEFAAMYDEAGEELCRFVRHLDPDLDFKVPTWLGHQYSSDGDLEVAHAVFEDGQRVGTVYFRVNSDDVWRELWEYVLVAFLVAVVSLAISIMLSLRLQRRLSAPILELAKTANAITQDGNYRYRVQPTSSDEIGHLVRAFNQMLDKIEMSDAALKAIHEQLEDRVMLRTAQLTQEIIEREQIQADLIKAKEAAEAANHAKSDFLANMSHEIRTPLNAVLGFADLLRRNDQQIDRRERDEYLDTIHASGEHLLTLINDILDISKIEAGQLQIEQISCSPHHTIQDVVNGLRIRAQERGLNLIYEWKTSVPDTIVSDPARIRQLIFNIAGNAIKFTERGQVSVTARITGEQEAAKLVIEVADTGIGIPASKLDSIFDPFTQADTSVTRRFGGTGLGLAICRRLARALGGDVTVSSVVGKGSKFIISLATGSLTNVRLQPWSLIELNPVSQRSLAVVDCDLNGKRILVVDDGDTNRKLLQLILKRAHATVATAENGLVAVNLVQSQSFDLVFMDMQMPVMDGYTATTRIRSLGFDLPIIALTAHALKGDEEKCLSAGCTSFLSKPIDQDKLFATLSRLLAKTSSPPAPAPVRPVLAATPSAAQIASEASGKTVRPAALTKSSASQIGAPIVSTLPLDDRDYCEIVIEFVERLHLKMAELQVFFDRRQFAEMKPLVHWLKGAGGTAGFADLTTLARHLENAILGHDDHAVGSFFAELVELVKRVEAPQLPSLTEPRL